VGLEQQEFVVVERLEVVFAVEAPQNSEAPVVEDVLAAVDDLVEPVVFVVMGVLVGVPVVVLVVDLDVDASADHVVVVREVLAGRGVAGAVAARLAAAFSCRTAAPDERTDGTWDR